jgi:hypothetical protein
MMLGNYISLAADSSPRNKPIGIKFYLMHPPQFPSLLGEGYDGVEGSTGGPALKEYMWTQLRSILGKKDTHSLQSNVKTKYGAHASAPCPKC